MVLAEIHPVTVPGCREFWVGSCVIPSCLNLPLLWCLENFFSVRSSPSRPRHCFPRITWLDSGAKKGHSGKPAILSPWTPHLSRRVMFWPAGHTWCSKAGPQSFVPSTRLGLSVRARECQQPLEQGSSSLKYTTTCPSSGVPILYLRVRVGDAIIKGQRGVREVSSWWPVSGLVQPWPRRNQPNECRLWHRAVGTLLKLVHAHDHNTCRRPDSGNGCVTMTKVCGDQPIRHQEKWSSANLDNLKMKGVMGVKNFLKSGRITQQSDYWMIRLWKEVLLAEKLNCEKEGLEGELTGFWTLQFHEAEAVKLPPPRSILLLFLWELFTQYHCKSGQNSGSCGTREWQWTGPSFSPG